ncbi:MAG TPA: HlyD family secretion protein [Candidatus Saccharimonadaceae bacterium]|jgi:membrane fusion protein (multidrug efflux system)|nr:HlyD family secretion protein [Candidatus Saccharimonadaceae bacterium]
MSTSLEPRSGAGAPRAPRHRDADNPTAAPAAADGAPAAPAVPPAGSASASSASAATAAPTKRSPVLPIVGALALILLGFLGWRWWVGRAYVSSDNAQVQGHVVPILPKIAGFVSDVRVVENQDVKAGDVLVTIDDRDFRARLAQADADLDKEIANAGSRGNAGQTQAQLAAARAAVAQAEANVERADADLARYRPLAERGIVSRQQLDAAQAGATANRAQLDAAREQVSAALAAWKGADARVASAKASRDQAALMVSYATITAPASGKVSRKTVEVGQLVQAGQPLLNVVPLDDVWVVANLKETEIKDVTPGDAVEIAVDSYPGLKFQGKVESLSPATGATFSLLPPDNATGNFTKVVQRIPVRVHVDSAQDPRHPLRPGMSVTVKIKVK